MFFFKYMTKEGKSSSIKHLIGNKKRIKCFHYKNKRHMIKEYKIKIIVEIIATIQAKVVNRNERYM